MPHGETQSGCRADEGVRAGARPGGRSPCRGVLSFTVPRLGGTGGLEEQSGCRIVSERQAQWVWGLAERKLAPTSNWSHF